MTKPFRWSLSKREQLGSWPSSGQRPEAEFLSQLRATTARIIAMSDGANLAFIGRSPENFFDYLSGVFAGLNDAPHLHIIQYSLRWAGEGGVASIAKDKRDALFAYFRAEGFDPAHIAASSRPVALVDFISTGGTMETLTQLLKMQAEQGRRRLERGAAEIADCRPDNTREEQPEHLALATTFGLAGHRAGHGRQECLSAVGFHHPDGQFTAQDDPIQSSRPLGRRR